MPKVNGAYKYKKVKGHSKYIYAKRTRGERYKMYHINQKTGSPDWTSPASDLELSLYKRERRSARMNYLASAQFSQLIGWIFGFIFLIVLFRLIMNPDLIGQKVSIRDILRSLEGISGTDFMKTLMGSSIPGDWGAFEFLRNFLNGVWSVLVSLIGAIGSIITFALGLLKILFV